MAINTTGNNGSVVGVTGVTPDNLGKSFKWSAATNKYEVGISSVAGNLLSIRGDGLYYGIEAPADTSNLYVSSSTGDDSNKGTRTSPLRTIREAFRRNSVGTRFVIHILETDVHEWRSSWSGDANGKVFTMLPYGDVMDDVNRRNPVGSYGKYRSKEIIRPRIVFIPDRETRIGSAMANDATVYHTNSPTSSPITFLACILDLTATPALPINRSSRSVFGAHGSTPSRMYFTGCDFLLGNTIGLVTIDQYCDLGLDNVKIDTTQGNKFIHMSARGVLNLGYTGVDTNKDGQQMLGQPPGQIPLTHRAGTPNTELLALIEGTNRSRIAKTHIFTNVDLE